MPTPLAAGYGFSGQAKHRMSFGEVKQLAEAFGLPGAAIAQIARGESSLYADIQQHDPGDGMVGYGLLQMTPNAWGKGSAAYRYMQHLGGVQAMKDPVKNMAMARFLYKAAGNKLSPWYGTRFLTNRSGEGRLGPIDHSRISAGLANAVSSGGQAPSGGSTRTITTTTPGVDNRVARAALIQSFLDDRNADPVNFAMQARGLADVAPTTSSRTVRTPGVSPSGPSASASFNTPKLQSGVANFEGKKVAAWIAPALDYARRHGWKGTVTSGFRSFADQTRIYNSGVRPAARPGTSNHEGTDFPRGAVDVSDAQTLAQILQRSPYGGRLKWAGAKDPVHFSHPHNGSY